MYHKKYFNQSDFNMIKSNHLYIIQTNNKINGPVSLVFQLRGGAA